MILRLSSLIFVLNACAFVSAQDDSTNVVDLVQKLRNLSIIRIDTDADAVIARQRKRIELANKILNHEDTDEPHRIFATVTQIQALGIQFNALFRKKNQDSELNNEFAEAIEFGLEDSDDRIVLEAKTADASFGTGMYILDPNEQNAEHAANALIALNGLAPKDPLIQASRRVLLEQLWKSDKPKLAFQKLAAGDDEAAPIVLDQIEGTTKRDEADFLWAKHFARYGDFVSQRHLASMYETGKGTRISNSQAARWYTKLANFGDRFAMVKLGDFYMEGKGYSKNPKLAVKQYRLAANNNSRLARFKLAECYLNGTGVKQDDEKWQTMIKSAAFNASAVEVQEIYSSISFTDSADSYRLFYEALVEQYPDDIYYLNNFAYSLLISSDKDPDLALKMINKAIEEAPDDFKDMPNFIDTKATAFKQLRKWKEAAGLFESIEKDMDDKKEIWNSLVECYEHFDNEKADKYRKLLANKEDGNS